MRKFIIFLLIIMTTSCQQEGSWDCIQKSGDIIEQSYQPGIFTKIRVNRGVELILKQSEQHNVKVVTGENLLNDVDISLDNNQLIISDFNHCNFVRDYNITKVYVTSPNIEEIVCSTQYPISSVDTLNYDQLNLVSENYQKPDVHSVGDFDLTVNCNKLNVFSNGVSIFNIDGQVNDLFVGFYSGVGRFEGKALKAENAKIFHDGQNDIIVNPQQSLSGQLRSTGNVLSFNEPPELDIFSLYQGEIIFIDN